MLWDVKEVVCYNVGEEQGWIMIDKVTPRILKLILKSDPSIPKNIGNYLDFCTEICGKV